MEVPCKPDALTIDVIMGQAQNQVTAGRQALGRQTALTREQQSPES